MLKIKLKLAHDVNDIVPDFELADTFRCTLGCRRHSINNSV